MVVLAAIAGVVASTLIYATENVVDRKVTTKIEERRAEKLAAQQQAEATPAPAQAQVYVPATQVTAPAAMEVQAPAQAPVPAQTTREAELEAQLLQMQQAFAQLQAAQTAPAPASAPTETSGLLKKGQMVSIVDTAEPLEGDLNTLLPPDKRVGRVSKINPDDGTVRVNVPLGGKSGARAITVSEYDVVPV